MGSRILSRSFHVEKWEGCDHEDNEDEEQDSGSGAAMDVDCADETPDGEAEQDPAQILETSVDDDDDEEDEDAEDPADVAMVPMADMLNARFESENVRCDDLFHLYMI